MVGLRVCMYPCGACGGLIGEVSSVHLSFSNGCGVHDGGVFHGVRAFWRLRLFRLGNSPFYSVVGRTGLVFYNSSVVFSLRSGEFSSEWDVLILFPFPLLRSLF